MTVGNANDSGKDSPWSLHSSENSVLGLPHAGSCTSDTRGAGEYLQRSGPVGVSMRDLELPHQPPDDSI